MFDAVANLTRQAAEVHAFLDACPQRPSDVSSAETLLLDSLPSLRKLVAENPHLCNNEDREVLERCLFDMASEGVLFASFIEFGLWVLDCCTAQGSDAFFEQVDASEVKTFLENELFRYCVLHKRHQAAELPNSIRTSCAQEWCGLQGILCCACCLKVSNRRVTYCSRECQMKHWLTHKHTCDYNRVKHGADEGTRQWCLDTCIESKNMPSLE